MWFLRWPFLMAMAAMALLPTGPRAPGLTPERDRTAIEFPPPRGSPDDSNPGTAIATAGDSHRGGCAARTTVHPLKGCFGFPKTPFKELTTT